MVREKGGTKKEQTMEASGRRDRGPEGLAPARVVGPGPRSWRSLMLVAWSLPEGTTVSLSVPPVCSAWYQP